MHSLLMTKQLTRTKVLAAAGHPEDGPVDRALEPRRSVVGDSHGDRDAPPGAPLMMPPRITMVGRHAIESGRPLYVRTLDGCWVLGTEHTRARALRFLASGLEYATWIYGVVRS